MEFLPYPFKLWNSYPGLLSIGSPTLSFQTLEFLPYRFKHWNSHLILKKKHWNFNRILLNVGIPTLSF